LLLWLANFCYIYWKVVFVVRDGWVMPDERRPVRVCLLVAVCVFPYAVPGRICFAGWFIRYVSLPIATYRVVPAQPYLIWCRYTYLPVAVASRAVPRFASAPVHDSVVAVLAGVHGCNYGWRLRWFAAFYTARITQVSYIFAGVHSLFISSTILFFLLLPANVLCISYRVCCSVWCGGILLGYSCRSLAERRGYCGGGHRLTGYGALPVYASLSIQIFCAHYIRSESWNVEPGDAG
jgi:hypothetical protein